ncbi:hypothetical protein [Vasconcelosia minhoensis]|uniref:hypothetical protein n=1 Tax=Vasconcelosia minhoensis TaxID=3366354 RepID=UPI0036F34CE0
MLVSLNLPPDLETELSIEASNLRLSLPEYILRILSFRPYAPNLPKTGSELVAYWESMGIIGSRPDIADSQIHARQLRHQAEIRE